MAKTFKDPYTLDGIYKMNSWVTPEKVLYAKELFEEAWTGDAFAEVILKESLSSSEMPFNIAQLTNINFYEQFESAQRTWRSVATSRVSPSLERTILYSLNPQWSEGNGTLSKNGDDQDPFYGAPTVPEGSAYPYAYLEGVESKGAGLRKAGFKTDFTLEAQERDPLGFIASLPGAMLDVALDTEEIDVFNGLINGVGAGQQLAGGAVVESGVTVPANAKLSRDALLRAIYELKRRRINGKFIQITGGYNLIVPVGVAEQANFLISNLILTSIDDANLRYNVTGQNPLSGISVVESPFVADDAWYLLPKPGALRGRPVLEHLTWSKQQAPELRVEDVAGFRLGTNLSIGGKISPLEGSFDNDSITFRLRMFSGVALWTPEAVVWSNGSGS